MKELVELAGDTKVYYSQTEERDSLIEVIADKGAECIDDLINMLDTPWPVHFQVLKTSLETIGEPARAALIERLRQRPVFSLSSRMLIVLERLGKPGDEKVLDYYLKKGGNPEKIAAIRCLAAFGSQVQSVSLLVPCLVSKSAQVRLAAVWALGKLPIMVELDRIAVEKIRPLLKDSCPQVRFTAAETLGILGVGDEEIPRPLYPVR